MPNFLSPKAEQDKERVLKWLSSPERKSFTRPQLEQWLVDTRKEDHLDTRYYNQLWRYLISEELIFKHPKSEVYSLSEYGKHALDSDSRILP